MGIDNTELERMIEQILREKLKSLKDEKEFAGTIIKAAVPNIQVSEADRMDTGNPAHRVYTHDLFSLGESPRLGCGIMEMERTTFDWTLDYDEIDYVIEGRLTIHGNGGSVTAGPGELILIPRGSKIQFSVENKARFIYVTYPADWAGQNG